MKQLESKERDIRYETNDSKTEPKDQLITEESGNILIFFFFKDVSLLKN